MNSKYFMMFFAVTSWASKALMDGKVSKSEIADLIETIASLHGVTIDIDWNN